MTRIDFDWLDFAWKRQTVYFVSHTEYFDSHYLVVGICLATWQSGEVAAGTAAAAVPHIPCFSAVAVAPSVADGRICSGAENHQRAQILGRLNLHIVDLMNNH
jgi:hypothetical protein